MKADEWYAPLFSMIQASGLSHQMVGSPTRSLCQPLGAQEKIMSLEKEVAELISKHVSWFNGWYATDEACWKSCRQAARAAIRKVRLTKRAVDGAKRGSKSKAGSHKSPRKQREPLAHYFQKEKKTCLS